MKIDLKKLGIIGGLLISGLFATSCLDDDSSSEPFSGGWVAFVNASPDASSLKFYSNGNVINSSGIPYGQYFGYLSAPTGVHNLTVRSGNNTDRDTVTINVGINKYYSVFAVNLLDNIELLAFEDNFLNLGAGKSGVRFSQFSPDAPLLRVEFEGEADPIGVFGFKQSTTMKEINAATDKKMFLIDEETSDTLLTKTYTFKEGFSYAVFSKGLVNSTSSNQNLDIQVIPFN